MLNLICLAFLTVVAQVCGRSVVSVSETADISDLIAVVQIFRHGQRTPNYFTANDPYSDQSWWPVSSGQLTNVGKQQHYELGQFTRRRYDGFLPTFYNNDDFYAQTTDVDRTHMSAQSNLAGIFPPHEAEIWNSELLWQPIPIHPSDEEVISGSPSCSIYSAETANVVANAEEYIRYNEEYADVYKIVTDGSGYNVTSVEGVFMVFDALMIENQFGFLLPEWTNAVFPDPLSELTALAFKAYTYTDTQKRLMAGNWLYVVSEYFSEMWEDSSSSPKYQVYSAHDTNIAAILNTLGAFRPHYPSFASTLYLELRNKSGNAVINIYHRNDGVFEQVTVRGCDFDCTLDEFNTNLSPWLVDTDAWETECNKNSTDLTDLSTVMSTPELAAAFQEVVAHGNHRRPSNKPNVI